MSYSLRHSNHLPLGKKGSWTVVILCPSFITQSSQASVIPSTTRSRITFPFSVSQKSRKILLYIEDYNTRALARDNVESHQTNKDMRSTHMRSSRSLIKFVKDFLVDFLQIIPWERSQ